MALADTITNANLGAIGSTIFLWLVIIVLIVVFSVVIFFFALWLWRVLKFKVNVIIYEHIGENQHFGTKEIGQEVNEVHEGKRRSYLHLFKSRKKIGPFGSDAFSLFGTRKHLNLHLENGIYTPLPIAHSSSAALKFEKGDLLTALQLWDQDYAENLETHKLGQGGFWDKYGSFVMPFAMILIMFVLFFILIQQMQSGVNITATLDTRQIVDAVKAA